MLQNVKKIKNRNFRFFFVAFLMHKVQSLKEIDIDGRLDLSSTISNLEYSNLLSKQKLLHSYSYIWLKSVKIIF